VVLKGVYCTETHILVSIW